MWTDKSGGYARGTWVDEPHTAKGYQSDFDLLIIVNDKRLTDRVKYWLKLEERLHTELAMAREYFDEWMPSGMQFMETAKFTAERGWNKKAAFLLRQATESLYHCVLLVVTFYTPHVHNLAFLRTQAERIDARLTYVWPTGSRKERALFEKLKEAYVKARYSKHFRVTAEDLAWLSQRIEELGHAVCADRIAELEAAAR